jgi:2-oxoglutarate ferredoxin oxidoreductase subunit alpha
MSLELLEGSEAIARAMISAGCRFFAGYPMTPFTEVLEGMAEHLPEVGGVCVNAESELEAIGMAWGAAAGGTRAATGSVGQGLSLMQESIAELCFARVPMVVLNMARGQGDYYQATRAMLSTAQSCWPRLTLLRQSNWSSWPLTLPTSSVTR